MGRKERRSREEKRENYATKHSAEKRKHMLITIGVLGVIAVIVGYASLDICKYVRDCTGRTR